MRITIEDDFDPDKIIRSGQCFRPQKISKNTYRFITCRNVIDMTKLSMSTEEADDAPSVFDVSCTKSEWDNIWHPYFDLDTCYADIRKSIPKSDRFLTKAANAGKGIRILKQDKYEMLISFIISQRKSIPAIRKCVENIVGLYGTDGFFPDALAMLNATEEEFKSCGLGYRLPYVKKAAERVAHHDIDLEELDRLSDEQLFEELKTFSGVGDKVANCVELFAYHRTGRAPVDTWISKVINEHYKGENPFPRYKEFAGIMQQYMFYYAISLR